MIPTALGSSLVADAVTPPADGTSVEVQESLDRANQAIQAESPDAVLKVNEAIGAMKQGFL